MLPASFAKDGFVPLQQTKGKLRRLLIATDGWAGTGKTEFMCSAPGPGRVLCLDRMIDSVRDNETPPPTRNPDFGFKIIRVPLATQMASGSDYLPYWKEFFNSLKASVDDEATRTVCIDGDSDSWELQKLAEFGRLTQVPPIMYTSVNAARRALIARCWDSGKIVFFTNKLKEAYEGKIVDGKEVRIKSGGEDRQGFPDTEYLVHIQLRHWYRDGEYGLTITRCKADRALEGMELVGEECNFKSLVQLVYPSVPVEEWGY